MPVLTKRTVDAVLAGVAPLFIWDDQLAGFGLKVLPDGKRRYIVKYRVRGGRQARQRWFMLGAHGQITCEEARSQAKQILAAVARGEDPQGERAAGRAAPTVTDLWGRYEAEHLPRKKTQSGREDQQKADDYILPALGRLRVADVTRADVQRLHQRLSERPYQANRVLALASKMFNLAELWEMRPAARTPVGTLSVSRSSPANATSRPPNWRGLAPRFSTLRPPEKSRAI